MAVAIRSAGLGTARLDLLRIGNNFVYADRANDRVYRVPLRDGDADRLTMANDVFIKLAKLGAPILAPVQPAPLRLADSHVATVWPLGRPVRDDPAVALAPVLAKLHSIPPVDGLGPWNGFDRSVYRIGLARSSGVPADILDELEHRLITLRRDFPPWPAGVVAHGDPHTGNLVRVDGRLLLVDLDDLALGCPEIDLAPLRIAYRRFPAIPGTWEGYLAAYGRQVDRELLEWFAQLRQLTMMAWLLTLWNARPESRQEARHRMATLDIDATWSAL